MHAAGVRICLCGVPLAELLVHGVAQDYFEDVQGFVHGTREVDVPPVESDGLVQGWCFADVGCKALGADPVLEDQVDGVLCGAAIGLPCRGRQRQVPCYGFLRVPRPGAVGPSAATWSGPMRVSPHYSFNPSAPDVRHTYSDCISEKQIPAHNKRSGTSNYPLCQHCRDK